MSSNWILRSVAALGFAAASAGASQAAGGAARETGIWYDDTGRGAVKIEMCGSKLCGKIYWLKELVNAEGKPLIDRHNPNENQRNRPICGLQVFGGLSRMEGGDWDSGWIYDPKEGKSYSVAMVMTDEETLKVTGYLVMKMMGRTLTWKRAPADLPSCAQNAAAQPAAPAAAVAPSSAKASKVGAAAPAAEAVAPAKSIDKPAVKPAAKSVAAPSTTPAVKSAVKVPAANAGASANAAGAAAKSAGTTVKTAGAASAAKSSNTKSSDTKSSDTKSAGTKPAGKAASVQTVSKTGSEELPWAAKPDATGKKPVAAKKKAPAAASTKPATEASKLGAASIPGSKAKDTKAQDLKPKVTTARPTKPVAADVPIQQLP